MLILARKEMGSIANKTHRGFLVGILKWKKKKNLDSKLISVN